MAKTPAAYAEKKKPLLGGCDSYTIKNVLPMNSGFEKIKAAVFYFTVGVIGAPIFKRHGGIKEESQAVIVDRFLSVVRRYAVIEELTPAIVHEFIDRIIVHEPEQARGDRRQKVDYLQQYRCG